MREAREFREGLVRILVIRSYSLVWIQIILYFPSSF
jgi:hypothetical protein